MSHGICPPIRKKDRRQMQFELERKGIPRELIRRGQEAMEDEEGCVDETDMIRQLLEKRCRNPKEADEKEKDGITAI